MPESFVPLLPNLPRSGGTTTGYIPTQVLPQQKAANRFLPMTDRESKPVAATGLSASPAASQACASQPQVNLVREGEVVKRIQVQCGCGQLIELDCV